MGRKNKGYTHIKELAGVMERMRSKGKTYKDIAIELGLRDKEVVRNCIRREKKRSFQLALRVGTIADVAIMTLQAKNVSDRISTRISDNILFIL